MYLVISVLGGWTVLYQGYRTTPVSDRQMAIQHAIEHARNDLVGAPTGVEAVVYVQEDDLSLRKYWASIADEGAG